MTDGIDRPDLGGSRLVALRIMHLRNLRQVALRLPAARTTIIVTGGNGAGKTTLLESIYLLARGRSFRGRKAGPLIARDSRSVGICGVVYDSPHGERRRIDFRRGGDGTQWLLDGRTRESSAIDRMPLAIKFIGENAQHLLEGDPALRRTFLDWNTFHVEPGFGALRQDVARILAQRHAALRAGGRGLSAWDAALADAGERLTAARTRFFTAWRLQFLRLAADFDFLVDCDLRFHRGWPEERSLAEALADSRDQDRERGYTLAGPGRADFNPVRGAGPLTLSRGQAKVVVCLLQLAAEWVHRAQGLAPTLWLLDDLEAELDRTLLHILWDCFRATGSQSLVTRVAAEPHPGCFDMDGQALMFHVEHGALMFHGVS